MATAAITDHWNQLRKAGLDLGAAQGDEQDAGYGGKIQVYERGRIYWHASTGAHELHGRILDRYLQSGGHDVNPATGERELGFPRTDIVVTEDGQYECAAFEWGAIADVSGTALVRLFGTLYQAWIREGSALGRLGHPIEDVARFAGGRLAWFERGFLWHAEGSDDVLVAELVVPTLGQPALVPPGFPPAFEWIRFDGAVGALDANPALADDIVRGRLMLLGVGGGATIVLNPGTVVDRFGRRWLPLSLGAKVGEDLEVMARTVPIKDGVDMGTVGTGGPAGLEHRCLYSLAFNKPGLAPKVISPHCLYAQDKWQTFGIAHISDIHCSRRIDWYRAQLRRYGVTEDHVAKLNNWNDRFREFIRYANHLHQAGLLDVIIATGDLVDFDRELGDHAKGPGNFSFFEALVQGHAPSPDDPSVPREALHVPIFTSLGNHDYREHPYFLGFKQDVHSSDLLGEIPYVGKALENAADAATSLLEQVPGVGYVESLDPIRFGSGLIGTIWNYAGLNVYDVEAKMLMGCTLDGKNFGVPKLRPEDAAAQASINKSMADRSHYYFRRINKDGSYMIRLGAHRVVMLDTRYDEGVVGTVADAVITKLGFGTESQENFVGGSPDSVGPEPEQLTYVRTALEEAGTTGQVIVGMHAPPINPKNNDYANCLRETVHPSTDPKQVYGYLARNCKDEFVFGISPGLEVAHPKADEHRLGWTRTGTPYFHVGEIEDMLDYGISVGQQEALAQLFAGKDVSRPVNLVVCGHGHYRIEYRLRWNGEKLEAYTDHYLENPPVYYPTKLVEGDWWKPETHKRYLVHVEPGSPPDGTVVPVKIEEPTIWPDMSELHVPPYASPLSDTLNPSQWWNDHSPVIVQTAALGPCTNTRPAKAVNENPPGPNFAGFRMIEIKDNVIEKVHYVLSEETRAGQFPLSWEPHPDGTRPDPRDRLKEMVERLKHLRIGGGIGRAG